MLNNTKKPEPLAAQTTAEEKTAPKAEQPVAAPKAEEIKSEKPAAATKTEKAAAATKAKAEKAAAVAAAKAEKAAAAAKAKAEKAAAAAKAKAEKAPRKRTVGVRKAAAPAVKLYVQYQGKELSQEDAVEAVKAAWTGEAIKTLELYVKPEDGAIYYVINGSVTGKVSF